MKNVFKKKTKLSDVMLESQLTMFGLKKKDIATRVWSETPEGMDAPNYYIEITIKKGYRPVSAKLASNVDYRKNDEMLADAYKFAFQYLTKDIVTRWLKGSE